MARVADVSIAWCSIRIPEVISHPPGVPKKQVDRFIDSFLLSFANSGREGFIADGSLFDTCPYVTLGMPNGWPSIGMTRQHC